MNRRKHPIMPATLQSTYNMELDLSFAAKKRFPPSRRLWLLAAAVLVLWLAGVMIYQTHKLLPPGLSSESPVYKVQNVHFWHDLTYQATTGRSTGKSRSCRGYCKLSKNRGSFWSLTYFCSMGIPIRISSFLRSAGSFPISLSRRK